MRLAGETAAVHALARALPGVRFEHSGGARSIAVEGAEVGLLLADGRAVVGKVLAVDEERVSFHPWGCASATEIAVGEIVVAATASARWATLARVGARQRKEWR